jgi:hypothetical protein
MAANETHQSDKIKWEQPSVVTSDGTLRAGTGRSRFGTYMSWLASVSYASGDHLRCRTSLSKASGSGE